MRLFRSEWMFEPVRDAGLFATRGLRRGFRAAGHAAPVRAACPPLPTLDGASALERATIEHERAVLRRLAEYDRAA